MIWGKESLEDLGWLTKFGVTSPDVLKDVFNYRQVHVMSYYVVHVCYYDKR